MNMAEKWGFMRRYSREEYKDVIPAAREQNDPPAIQNLIEQLNRDLEETQRNASKAQ
jgi:hypothetical protein